MHDQTHSKTARVLGRLTMKLLGWKIQGSYPASPHSVIIAAPHTSNWDFVYLIAAMAALGVRIHWLGKASLFNHPLGFIMRWLGGIPVDRSRRNQLVSQIAERFETLSSLHIVVPPAGTRSPTDRWRSGFYHIAKAANVPIIYGFLDYPSKTAGLSQAKALSDDLRQDMDEIRTFYADKRGKFPDQSSKIRLAEESELPEPPQPSS